jgi:poly(3-hydroxybutyrate) depolymerase
MLYDWHETMRRLNYPATHFAQAWAQMLTSSSSPLSWIPGAEPMAANFELFHRMGKDYEKPEFAIHSLVKEGHVIPVVEQEVLRTPFCRLLRFKRFSDHGEGISDLHDDPAVLIVAPLSGHHATLLRDTVQTMLEGHKVYITDWLDARMVPASEGSFSLDDYVATIERFIEHIGAQGLHVMAVCQPVVPVLGAISLMSARGAPVPASMILIGGPVDARESPTAVNGLATRQPLSWFEQNLIHRVPQGYPGAGRRVYPGFLQHLGFVAMNPEKHARAHWDFYQDLVQGDKEDAATHRKFYDEYNAVLDMPSEYYLQTISVVFQEHLLPRGKWIVAGNKVDPSKIKSTALLTIEGEKDDIAGQGQTRAAQTLCSSLRPGKKEHLLAKGAGHYGLFSGRRWRNEIYPQVKAFIAKHHPKS